MKNLILFFLCLLTIGCSQKKNDFNFKTDHLQISVDEKGFVNQFVDLKTGKDYVQKDSPSPILALKIDSQIIFPEKATYEIEQGIIQLLYVNGNEAKIKIEEKSSHIVFELLEVKDNKKVDLAVWGPFTTTINKIIGETIGVVQGAAFSLGIQALNPKTLGGYPWNDNDCMPQIDIFESGDFSDLSEKGKRHVLYRIEAAKPTDSGSSLQAYCRNRISERVIENWHHERYTIPTFNDGGIIGSKVAIFGCPVESTLETIGKIEIEEGLPHPMIDGQWVKQTPNASAAYMIMGFGEADIEKAIAYTKQAGLKYLYHDGPFKNWGHFELNEQFPNGWDGLKNCVEKAEAQGLHVGLHTLSNFITTNDPYVTPIPDPRLGKVGSSILTETIDATQTEIPVKSPDFFNQFENTTAANEPFLINHLKTVQIGNELIRYNKVSEQAPWKLLDCERGAYKTSAASHQNGSKISKLADHGYKVFLTDPQLTIEMSAKVAELFNYCGLRQISFDGLEGNRSTGMGNYGEILFTNTWFNKISDDIKAHYIADASRTSHYFWHMYTRMNWGEPWYAGFRESQTDYRIKNQKYFRRNLMPTMLGWFKLHPITTVEDIEWMLARSAAFDAGYGFVANYKNLEENGNTDKILSLLGEWEKARLAGAFPKNLKVEMEDISREYHLETIADNHWNLYEIYPYRFKHEKKVRQPGEPLHSTFMFENQTKDQPVHFILSAVDASISNIKLEINNHKEILLPITLKNGQHAKYSGGDKLIIYTENWQKIKEIPVNETDLKVATGGNSILFDCSFADEEKEPVLKIELRLTGTAHELKI